MRREEGIFAAVAASGLRPASAFVAIAVVLLAVTAKAAHIAFVATGDQPTALVERSAPRPAFEITDRAGRSLAMSVECFDLTMSPRAMWRSHTPARMAQLLADVLGSDPGELVARMLPRATNDAGGAALPAGLLRVHDPRLLRFDAERARRVDAWLQRGALEDGEGRGRIAGLWLSPLPDGSWTLEWEPATLLSLEERRRHLGEELCERPELWTRQLLHDLSALVGDELPAELERALASLDGSARRAKVRDALWAELMPATFRVVRRRLDPMRAHRLVELLRAEAVSPWQMQLRSDLDRRHPVRPAGTDPLEILDGPSPDTALREDAFSVLGHWGVLGPEDALARAREERDATPWALDWFGVQDPVEERAWELQTEWRAWSGLELLCATELERPRWDGTIREGTRTYTRRMRQVARDRRQRWRDRRVPNYFDHAQDAEDVPRFESTLDAVLQGVVHAELVRLAEEYRAAVVEAIALDVESGDVLAVDAVYGYPISGFAPVRHAFTPGSTMKAVIMAIALDAGVVRPDEMFQTYAPEGIRVGNRPTIREAIGAPDDEWVSAEQGLAQSVNAVLVQIGLRVPAAHLREKLVQLGYASRPGAGLGPEAAGHVPELRKGTWHPAWEHASVSFGHELSVSLWQHAAVLATIARGGVVRPLRLVRAVEQDDRRLEITVVPGERVLSERACRAVRGMLATGAREGTGDDVASPQHCPEFSYIGTKTGTTEKVQTEVSLHVEWPRQIELAEQGKPWTRSEYRALVGARNNLGIRNTCYTASMCAVGRVAGDEREVLVLVVVDEPRSELKFGADVAGRSAIAILRRAHGLAPLAGDEPEPEVVLGAETFNANDLPWAEGDPCDWTR